MSDPNGETTPAERITTPERLVFNTLLNVLTLVGNALIGFFLIRFFLEKLGEERYGVWLLLGGGFFRYSGLLSMGLNSAVNRYVPVRLARNDTDGLSRVVSTSLFFFTGAAVVLAIVTVVVRLYFDAWFEIEPRHLSAAGWIVLLVGFCAAIAMPLQVSSGVLSGLQRFDLINGASLVMLIARTAVLVVLLSRGYGLVTMALAFGLSEVMMRLTLFFYAKKLLIQFRFDAHKLDFDLLKEMLSYGANTFLYTMGAVIMYSASGLVIAVFMGTAEVSQFTIATASVLLLSQLVQAFSRAIKPAVSDLDARGDHSTVKEIAFAGQKYSLLIIIPGACFLVLMGGQFLDVWVGQVYMDKSVIRMMGTILALLTIGHCSRLAQHSNFVVLVGRGQHRVFGILTAIMAVLCVVLSAIAVGVFDFGLIGIAWANLIPMVLISGVALPVYFNSQMDIRAREALLRVWWPAFLGGLPGVVLICIWQHVAPPDSWAEILAVVISVMLVTFASAWLLSLSELERRRFRRMLCRRSSIADSVSRQHKHDFKTRS